MVRPMPIHVADNFCSLPLAMGLFITVSVLVALCARHAKKVPRKYSSHKSGPKVEPKSPLPSSKKIITDSSNDNVDPLINRRKSGDSEAETISNPEEKEEGLWRKAILMGEKCQPPEFSGVLFYDSYGNRIAELPRSPRAMPLNNFSSFPAPQDTR